MADTTFAPSPVCQEAPRSRPVDTCEIWKPLHSVEELSSHLGFLIRAFPPTDVKIGLYPCQPSTIEGSSLPLIGRDQAIKWPGLTIAPAEGTQLEAWILGVDARSGSPYSFFQKETLPINETEGVHRIDLSLRFGAIIHLSRIGEIYHSGQGKPEIGSLVRIVIPDQQTLDSVRFIQQPVS